MENLVPLDVLSRWIHVGTTIVLVGGSVFMRFVLMPAADQLPEAEHDALRERVLGKWKKFVGLGILLLLVSGLYNYLSVTAPNHKGDGLYHALMGVKMLLAITVFVLASALVGRAAVFAGIRQNRKKWLGILILLAAVIVALAGFLKVAVKPATPSDKVPIVEAAVTLSESIPRPDRERPQSVAILSSIV